ncbi:protein of unknown function (plasmid) [Latilactobacillus sakei]|uniref:hypothetical protein n=1 Tax=Latilactobacillus sakei TaxID=1599 RepID=UPI000C6F173B|nr:hypothetical protein [Latilactobacillus sakei]SON74471.1 protein of unknown function [Latilactobacillus sakei]
MARKAEETGKVKLAAWVDEEAREYIEQLQKETKEKELYKPTLGQLMTKIILEHKKDHAGK